MGVETDASPRLMVRRPRREGQEDMDLEGCLYGDIFVGIIE
jgi:hypothetical protein